MSAAFISCDWGTSSFRLRVIEGPRVTKTFSSQAGIAATHSAWHTSGLEQREPFYREILEGAINDLNPNLTDAPVIISGMASSSIGMRELPYLQLPFKLDGTDINPTILPPTPASPRTILLIPGIRSTVDVMRGEETQLLGCGPATPGERMLIFPGTHSKHILIRNGQALDFRTYMTGELFALLSTQSILKASVTTPDTTSLPEAFFEGLKLSREYSFLHNAFLTRTNQLFNRYSKEDNYHFLSGLLIGEELQHAIKAPHPVTLVAASPLRESYAAALGFLGLRNTPVIDADEALTKGHCAIFALFGSTIAPPKRN